MGLVRDVEFRVIRGFSEGTKVSSLFCSLRGSWEGLVVGKIIVLFRNFWVRGVLELGFF